MTFHETTERRDADLRRRHGDARLRALIDSALDYAIFTTNDDGIIDSWSPGAQRMFGYTPNDAIGTDFGLIFTPADRRAGVPEHELAEARRNGRAVGDRYHLRRDGTTLYCSGVTRRLSDGGGGFVKIARDVTGTWQTANALQEANDALEVELASSNRARVRSKLAVTDLLQRLVSAQEDERLRIARDLHDQLGQQLTVLRLTLERAQASLRGDRLGEAIDRALAVTHDLDRDVDFLALALRPAPLDELGLIAALPRFVTEWSAHVGLATEFRLAGFTTGQLPRDVELTCYRVAQEALNNISKHAQATRVEVVLAWNDGIVTLTIQDDGVGFDAGAAPPRTRGNGLAGMRERAASIGGALVVESVPGRGTLVSMRHPAGD